MNKLTSLALFITTTILLMVIALYNGFGLAENDTGAYIATGINNIVPTDRSPFYGWFIYYTSFYSSLWYTLFAQCALLSLLLIHYINTFYLNTKVTTSTILISITSITCFTCVPWVAGYLMPDIFGAILLLATLLFLNLNYKTPGKLLFYTIIIYYSVIIHNSHFLILAAFALLLFIWSIAKKKIDYIKRSVVLISISFLGWFTLCTVNAVNGNQFTVSRGGHVFMMGKLVETGILYTYLNENCNTKKLKLCDYKNEIPAYSWIYIWDENSPMYKTGGWDNSKKENDLIIHDVFTTFRYLRMFLQKSAVYSLKQMVQFQVQNKTLYMGQGSSPWHTVKQYFADEHNEFNATIQNTTGLRAENANTVYFIFLIISSFMIVRIRHLIPPEVTLLYGFIIVFLILNAFVTATFSTVLPRYQNRIFWLLPATNAIVILKYYLQHITTDQIHKK